MQNPVCVSKYCTPITAGGSFGSCDTKTAACCGRSDAQACLISANLQDPCTNVANTFLLCPTTSGALATCLCSAGNFDSEVSRCASQVSQGSNTDIASFLSGSTGLLGFCSKIGGQTLASSGVSSSSMSMTTGMSGSVTSAGSKPASTASAPSATVCPSS